MRTRQKAAMQPYAPRADRVALSVPLSYRLTGDDEWFQTQLLNLSDSGLMFGPTTLKPGAQVDVLFALPFPLTSIQPGKVISSAQVVRTTLTGTVGARFGKRRYVVES